MDGKKHKDVSRSLRRDSRQSKALNPPLRGTTKSVGYNTPAFVQNASKNTRRKPNTPFRSRSVSKGKARLAPGFSVTPESGSVYEPGFSTFSSVRRLRARPSFVEFVSIGCDSPKPLTAVMRLGSTPCEVR